MMHFSQLELGQERSQAWRRVRKEPELQLLREQEVHRCPLATSWTVQ